MTPNVLTIEVDPVQKMTQDFSVKIPGPTMHLGRVTTPFKYADSSKHRRTSATRRSSTIA